MTPFTARLGLVAAAILLSTVGAVVKEMSLTLWQVIFLRSIVAAITLTALGRPREWRASWAVALVAVVYAATIVLFIGATMLTSAANAVLLQAAAPLYILIAEIVRGRRVGRPALAAAALIVVGVVVTLGPQLELRSSSRGDVLGAWLAVGSGLTLAGTIVGLRWVASSDPSQSSAATFVAAAGSLTAAIIALPFALPLDSISMRDAALVVYLGVVQIGISYRLIAGAIRHVPAFQAASILMLEVAMNPLWAWLVAGEAPRRETLLGGTATVAGALWLARVRTVQQERGAIEP